MDLVTGEFSARVLARSLVHSLARTREEEGASSLSHVHIDKTGNSLSEVGAQGCRWRHWSSSSSLLAPRVTIFFGGASVPRTAIPPPPSNMTTWRLHPWYEAGI